MKNSFLSFKTILKDSFRTTNCEQTAKLEQMFCPKGEGGHTPTCVPLPTFEGGVRAPHTPPPSTTPFFYASANLSCLFLLLIGTSSPNLFPLK